MSVMVTKVHPAVFNAGRAARVIHNTGTVVKVVLVGQVISSQTLVYKSQGQAMKLLILLATS